MEYQKICEYCGKEFTTESKRQMYCSKSCVKKASKIRRGLNVFDELRKINCKQCGKEFFAKNAKSKYCSDECRKKGSLSQCYSRKKKQDERKQIIERTVKVAERMSKTAEINAKARAEGLSWGQYVAKYKLY